MFRTLFALAVAVCFCSGNLIADEFKGSLSKIDIEKNTIFVGGSKKPYTLAKDAKILSWKREMGKNVEAVLKDGLKDPLFKVGDKDYPVVWVITEGQGADEVVKILKVRIFDKK